MSSFLCAEYSPKPVEFEVILACIKTKSPFVSFIYDIFGLKMVYIHTLVDTYLCFDFNFTDVTCFSIWSLQMDLPYECEMEGDMLFVMLM